jgi:MFS family permease
MAFALIILAADAVPDLRRAKSLLPKTHGTYATVLKALRRASASSKLEKQAREQTWRGKFDQPASALTSEDGGVAVKVEDIDDATPVPDQEQEPSFISTESWNGSKLGYEFKLGEVGLGYYRTAVENTQAGSGAAVATDTVGVGTKAEAKPVRPPLKTRGAMAELGAALRKQLLEKMEVGSAEDKVSSGDAFRAFNKSKSGFLSYKELQAGLTVLKISHSEDSKDMRRLLDRVDVNRDGKVCKADFRNFLGLDDCTDSDSDSEGSNSGGDDSVEPKARGRLDKDKRSWKQVAVSLVLPVYLPGMIFTAAGALAAPSLTLLAVELSGSKAAAGAALSLRALASLVMQVPAARFIAGRGSRKAMFAGGAASALAAILTAGASSTKSFVMLQLSLLASGLGAALWEVSRQQLMAAAIPPHVRGKAVALFGGVVRVAAVGGPALGGFLTQSAGQTSVFLLEGIALGVAAVSSRFVPKKFNRSGGGSSDSTIVAGVQTCKKRPKKMPKRTPTLSDTLREHLSRFLTAGVASALLSTVRGSRAVALPMVGAEIGLTPLQIGTCLSVASAVEAPLFIPAGWAYDHFGRKPVIIPGTAIVAAAWAAFSAVSTQRGMWFAAVVCPKPNALTARWPKPPNCCRVVSALPCLLMLSFLH